VLAQLDRWLDAPGEAGWVLVTGGPGMGKSAILSAWLARREHTGPVPHHFIRRQVADWDQPEAIAASLSAQIEAAFPALRDADAKPERRLIELLGRVSKQLGATGRLVVVVDGLDETRSEPGENPLPRFLPHVMPAALRFLCATRATYPHLSWLEARNPVRRLDLDARAWAASNDAVVRSFWHAAASAYQPVLPADVIAAAIARAEGNVLYAAMLHDALQQLRPEERRTDRIPRGLKELIGGIWSGISGRASVRKGLGVLCAAREALSVEILAELTGWSFAQKKRFIPQARQLLLEEPASWAGALAYRPRHDWVRELIAEDLGAAAMRDHHALLAQTLATWPARSEPSARRYALRHALTHRLEAGDHVGACTLAGDLGFLEAKCRELGVHETEADVMSLAERCRGSGDKVLGQRADDLARALARESHWLRSAPEATAALMWNRLRRFGWRANELDRQLRVPEGASFLRVRHAHTRQSPALVRDLVGHDGMVTACVVTPDGRHIVSASEDKTLKVWDLESGRALATLESHADKVIACAVTPDGRCIVSASWDGILKLWDVESRRVLATWEGHTDGVMACTVTPDGRCMVSASQDGTLKVWDLESRRVLATLEGHAGTVNACAVTPDGRRVVSGSQDGTLKVWDLESRRVLATLEGHTGMVNACAVTPDGRCVVSASDDCTLKVWDLTSVRELLTMVGHAHWVTACAVTPDGRHVISASMDHRLIVWDLESGRALATMAGHAHWVTACAVTPDGRRVVSASVDQMLKVWDLKSERTLVAVEGHADVVTACAVTPDHQRVVSASWDHVLKMWDLETGRARATMVGHVNRVTACAATPDGRCAVSASWDKTLKVWDLKSGYVLATLKGHANWVTACAVLPDSRCAVSASRDRTLKVWDLEDGRVLTTLEGHASPVNACAVTSDGEHVVSASDDETLKVWNLHSRRALATLEGHIARVRACVVTPDGRHVVSASDDKTLKVWNLHSRRALATLEGHAAGVRACAVTPDGQHVISASGDKTLKVWNLQTYACLLTHYGDSAYTAVMATETSIVAGDAVGSLWFLDWPP
jgi:WD40 repeat protein